MVIPPREIKAFQKEILDWYSVHKRDLPWRKTRDPYKILVSEIMLQQTQVTRVIPKYEVWMKRFPTVKELASAKAAEVLKCWSGLGYNRRALYLQKCAKTVVDTYEGIFPNKKEVLKTLPGIGEYTAAAVACFAFDEQIAVVDTNVRKVILVHFFHPKPIRHAQGKLREESAGILRCTQNDIKAIANQLLPKGRAYEWNQSLMDYASVVLKKEKIPLAKQSRFKGSDRYFRGQIIKQLLLQEHMSKEQIQQFFIQQQNPIEEKRLETILDGLLKNGLVQKQESRYVLP